MGRVRMQSWLYRSHTYLRLFYIMITMTFLLPLFIYAYIKVPGVTKIEISPVINIPFLILCFRVRLISLFLGICIWLFYAEWHLLSLRYVTYFLAKVLSKLRAILLNKLLHLFFFIILAIGSQYTRYSWLYQKNDWPSLLESKQIIIVLVLGFIFFALMQLFRARNRVVISTFNNYTGRKDLTPAVQSIAPQILNEMNRMANLFKTIDEARSKPGKDLAEAAVGIQDLGRDLADAVGPDSQVQIASFLKIPVGSLFRVISVITQGPIIRGSLKEQGDCLVLTARLERGRRSGCWQITDTDIDESNTMTNTEKIASMTCQMVCRIATDLVNIGSPKWRAVKKFTEGLRLYRDTLRSDDNKLIKLQEAKLAFKKAIAEDSKFPQCYYNLGIIYRDLGNAEAAEASFRKALTEKSDDFKSYYELAYNYYWKNEFNDARWFCDQALILSPEQSEHWNLLGVINYYDWKVMNPKIENERENVYFKKFQVPDHIQLYFEVAVIRSWRALCRAIIKGEDIQEEKNNAVLSLRNLAVLKGKKKKKCVSWLFKQALFLWPKDSDLCFELGKYFYRRQKWKKTYKALYMIYEDDKYIEEPMRYWACYAQTIAMMIADGHKHEEQEKFKRDVIECLTHFLDAAAELIYTNGDGEKKKNSSIEENENFEQNTKTMCHALEALKRQGFTAFTYHLTDVRSTDTSTSSYINRLRHLPIFKKMLEEKYKMNTQHAFSKEKIIKLPGLPAAIKKWQWAIAQRNITIATLIMKHCKSHAGKAVILLEDALKILNNEDEKGLVHHRQIKRLALHLRLAEAYLLDKKQLEKALEHSRQAVKMNPFGFRERKLLGEIYIELKDYQQAIKILESSFRLMSNDPEILEQIGKTYKEYGESMRTPEKRNVAFNAGVTFFLDVLNIIEHHHSVEGKTDNKSNDTHLRGLGKAHYSLGRFYLELLQHDEAIRHFNVAHNMGYKEMESLIFLGWEYISIKSYNEALQCLENAEKSYSELPDPDKEAKRKGFISIKIGYMTVLIDRVPSLKSNKFNCKSIKENIMILVEQIKKIDDYEKNRFEALLAGCWGKAKFKMGKFHQAARHFEAAVALNAVAWIYLYLAETYFNIAKETGSGKLIEFRQAIDHAYTACKLCRQQDLREEFLQEIAALQKKLEILEFS